METILTFAEKNRDKSFEELPFGIVDSLILSQISYFKYEGSSFEKIYFGKKVCEYYREYAKVPSSIIIKGMLTKAGDEKLIPILAEGGRHGALRACRYVEELSDEKEKQFAAITFEIARDEYFIAFRGTDTSIVGWKEDFAMSFQEEIPAQRAALEYARETMESLPGRFYIAGHSKGGNLAVYAAMNLPEAMQKRVKAVYSFDGPGFLKEVYDKSNYEGLRKSVLKIVPKSSVVGMMLEEYADYKVVQSTAELYWQHNPYTWAVEGNDFIYLEEEDSFSKLVKRSLDGWLEEIDFAERKKIINTVFNVMYDAGMTSFAELTELKYERIRMILEATSNVDQEEKRRVYGAVRRLLSITAEELRRTARAESAAHFEKSAAQLEKRAQQVETFLQSLQKGDN